MITKDDIKHLPCDIADGRLVLWQFADGCQVIETNGDSLWEDNHDGFDVALAEVLP